MSKKIQVGGDANKKREEEYERIFGKKETRKEVIIEDVEEKTNLEQRWH